MVKLEGRKGAREEGSREQGANGKFYCGLHAGGAKPLPYTFTLMQLQPLDNFTRPKILRKGGAGPLPH